MYSHFGDRTLDSILSMIVNNACGDGNILLSWGPKWDGEFASNEVRRLEEVGAWLKKNGSSIYGTRGGPWKRANWGGSTHRGDTCYLHITKPVTESLELPSLPGRKVKSAKMLDSGKALAFREDDGRISLTIPPADITPPDTIVELTMDGPLDGVKSIDAGHFTVFNDAAVYGKVVSRKAKVTTSSTSKADPGHPERLVAEGRVSPFAFHTLPETNPWVGIDLGQAVSVTGVHIVNRADSSSCMERAATLRLSVSQDGKSWTEVWQAEKAKPEWQITVTDTRAGAEVPGRVARYIRLEQPTSTPQPMHLQQVEVWGQPVTDKP